ncbi:MAG TPA: LamG-like jellyroll fold domain-containing protein [Candidatus Saccharimonadales bacterium]|nr:LamG-like jellyroll fold domain-containing protein [Candidatus Saccharimonadales bacterium]
MHILQTVSRRSRKVLIITVSFLIVSAIGAMQVLPATVAAATPTYVQSRAKEINSGITNSLAFQNANTTGDLLVVHLLWSNTSAVTLADSRGNAYIAATARTTWSTSWSAQTFYAKNVAAGANTVTATFATSISSFAIMQLHEYSGIDKTNPLAGSSAGVGSGTTMNSGTVTTASTNSLLFAGGGSLGNMGTIPSGWTQRQNSSGNKSMDRTVTAAGNYSVSSPHSGGAWTFQLSVFRADPGTDTTAPSAPGTPTATAASSSQINVAWTAATDNVGVTGHQVERCMGASCTTFALVATVATPSYGDTSLAPATLYRYRVRATDAAGNTSAYSAIAQATTQGLPDTAAPSIPSGLSGTGTSISQISLGWTASTDNVGVAGYRVYRNGAQVATIGTAAYQDTGLALNTAYTYAVSAFDAAGNESAQSTSVIVSTLSDTTPPSVPANLTAQVVSSTQINLNWTASSDNVGVTQYNVYRDGVFVNSSTVMPMQDAGLTPGTTYTYTVSARDAAGNESVQSSPVTASTPTPDTVPPTASMTAPGLGSTVVGTVTVSANATDNVAVADVDFLLDGVSIGVDTTAPYSVQWNTTTTSNGPHTLSARARDTAGNFGVTSGVVTVQVSNPTVPPLPDGLVAAYNFNESTGGTSADVTGNGNTATLANGALWAAGKNGSGLKLDGVNDYIEVANSPSINFSGTAMTFSAWVYPMAGGGDQVLFAKGYNGTMVSPFYQYAVELRGGGIAPTLLIGTTGGVKEAAMGSSMPVGQWSHFAVVFDGTRASFYLNGNLMSTPALAATMEQRNTPLRFGADAQPGQFMNGSVDDIRLYNRTLTQTEVQNDMNKPLVAPSTDPTGPTVTISSPAANAVVSNIITVSANAADDTGVAGVQFYVDGFSVGPEDTTAPYGAVWDTRAFTNGAHTLTARARDVSGNVTTASPVAVNVANSDYFQNEILATGLNLPTAMKFLPDGRMIVAELQGKIKVFAPPYTTASPTLFGQVTTATAGVQEGIFDLALDPNFSANHYYYVFYTAHTVDGDYDRLARLTANATLDGTVAGSETVLYQDPQSPGSDEHHGGAITFSNDGKIMVTTGEHFNGANAQNLASPRGKVLRINMDGTVPTDNPFYDGTGPNYDAIWSLGLRNPYRAYFDAPTNRMFIGDVGGNDYNTAYEEVNVAARGANFGWPNCENGNCGNPAYTAPLYAYAHNGRDAAVTGGFVYHGSQFPAGMQGNYFFADYAQNWIRRISFNADGSVNGVFNFEPINGQVDGPYGDIVYLTEGPDGALYYLDLGYSDNTGTFGVSKIRRIRYLQSNQAPIAQVAATPATGPLPLQVAFSSAGSNDPEGQPVTYLWDFGDGTTSTEANPSHAYTVAGLYTVRLTVSDGINSTFATPITIQAGSAPVATIAGPVDGATFRAGDVISYNGDATDAEDGTLPASAFMWTIDFLHEGHVHPGQTVTGAKNGTFTIPTAGHDFSGNTRYRITLTVTDSNGLTSTKVVTIWPEKVNLTFNTVPAGLTLYLDGIAKTAPFTYDTLIGFTHTIEARNQNAGGFAYTFANWSDAAAQTHSLTVPAAAQTYTATYTSKPLTTGPSGAWGFNETSGTTSADASGNNNIATLLNGLAFAAGKNGNGLLFDGVNDYLNIANAAPLDIAGTAFSMSAWLKPAGGGADQVLISKGWNTAMTSPYYQYGLELQSGGLQPVFQIGTASGVQAVGMGSNLTVNQWSHLAIVFNGTSAQFYVNGVLTSTKTMNATLTARGNALHLGADAQPGQYYKGALDDMRVYNRTLTQVEVQSDMNTGL